MKKNSLVTLSTSILPLILDLKTELVCLNPGIGFANLNRHQPLSILLTSGTLTPLDSFQSELMIKFPITLINSHVINPKVQVLFSHSYGKLMTDF